MAAVKERLESAGLVERLDAFLRQQRWFGGKARGIGSLEILDVIPMSDERVSADLVLASVKYADRYPDETYAIPLLNADVGLRETDSRKESGIQPAASETGGEIQDALVHPAFLTLLLKAVDRGLIFRGRKGEVFATPASTYHRGAGEPLEEIKPTLLKVEQSNSSVVFGDRFILKLLRQVGEGINPELEIGSFLTERARFTHVPAVTGSIDYRGAEGTGRTLAILQSFIPNQGNAWEYTLEALAAYFPRLLKAGRAAPPAAQRSGHFSGDAREEARTTVQEFIGPYLQAAELLGRRTAELHLALSSDHQDAGFAPEPLSAPYLAVLQRSAMEQCARVLQLLRGQLSALSGGARERAETLLGMQAALEQRLQSVADANLNGGRIRVHGDYHLGQVLCASGDFVIIDFEGEPARPLSERREKHSPLQDVAGMLRSFHYAAQMGMYNWLAQGQSKTAAPFDVPGWSRFWRDSVCSHFLDTYTGVAEKAKLLPRSSRDRESLLDFHLLSKAIYELGYELNNRPDWATLPLDGMLEVLGV